MNAAEQLTQLLALFSEKISQAVFTRTYPGREASRLPQIPIVTGEILSEELQETSTQARLGFRIYLPPHCGADTAEELFMKMCRLCSEHYSAFSAISREATERDSTTGLLTVLCTLTFVETTLAQGTGLHSVTLGGKEYSVQGVSVAMKYSEEPLVAIGESEPFAVQNEKTTYTVTVTGIQTLGLERVAGFTAVIGDTTYTGCRWTLISGALQKAVFVSEHRRDNDE